MSNTGTQIVKVKGRTFVVETIDNSQTNRSNWGDIDPATKTVSGTYGTKYKGGIHEDDSVITKENGFKDIVTLGIGESPYSYIDKICN